MTEKEIKSEFVSNYFENFKQILKSPKLRVYAIELPVKTNDFNGYADIVLINENKERFYDMQMIVLEFKKSKVSYGPIDQLHLYTSIIHKKFYRRNKTVGMLVAPRFSNYEIEQCKSYGYHALMLDENFNMKFIA